MSAGVFCVGIDHADQLTREHVVFGGQDKLCMCFPLFFMWSFVRSSLFKLELVKYRAMNLACLFWSRLFSVDYYRRVDFRRCRGYTMHSWVTSHLFGAQGSQANAMVVVAAGGIRRNFPPERSLLFLASAFYRGRKELLSRPKGALITTEKNVVSEGKTNASRSCRRR